MTLNLSSSLEDYLETIFSLSEREERVRVTDISAALNVEKSSVNSAVRKLKDLKLVSYEKYGNIELTQEGEREAKGVREKHSLLLEFLSDFLGIEKQQAERDACKVEHVISNETYYRLSMFIKFIDETLLKSNPHWRAHFENFLLAEKSGVNVTIDEKDKRDC